MLVLSICMKYLSFFMSFVIVSLFILLQVIKSAQISLNYIVFENHVRIK